jgi:hypothetical protein
MRQYPYPDFEQLMHSQVPANNERSLDRKITGLPQFYAEILNAIDSLLTADIDLEYLGENRERVLVGIRKALEHLREARETCFEATIGAALM